MLRAEALLLWAQVPEREAPDHELPKDDAEAAGNRSFFAYGRNAF